MKLVKPSFEIWNQESGIEGVYKQIERAGRVCYKSEDKIAEGTAKAFVDRMIRNGHCYTGETEVFTNKGWIKWKNYKGEQVAVINTDLTFKGYEIPSQIISKSYTGNFYKYPELGIEVTDGHRMYGMFADKSEDRYSTLSPVFFECSSPYKDANGREKTKGERFFRTANCPVKPTNSDAHLELIGFWIGDGCHNSANNSLQFHLKKKRKIEYLKDICNRAGDKYQFREGKGNYYYVDKRGIGEEFNTELYRDGNKYLFPSFDPVSIHSIIIGLLNSDGSYEKTGISYSSTSRQVIEWILEFAPIAGYSVTEGNTKISNLTTKKDVYKVFFLRRNYSLNNDSRREHTKVEIINKTDNVYCVTVSTGLLLVRGIHGKTTICGNCAMLEHGTVYLLVDISSYCNFSWEKSVGFYMDNPYSRVVEIEIDKWAVTTNYRVLVENDKLDDLQYLCEPTEYHERRVTVHFNLQIAISREFNRHRVNSIAEQSTRYCNYGKDKFGGVGINLPSWVDSEIQRLEDITENVLPTFEQLKEEYFSVSDQGITKDDWGDIEWWLWSNLVAEESYLKLIEKGRKPQEARVVLPLDTNTELVHTAFISDWEHFFDLRDDKQHAHPDAYFMAHGLHSVMMPDLYDAANPD